MWIIFIEHISMIITTIFIIMMSFLYFGVGNVNVTSYLCSIFAIFRSVIVLVLAVISGVATALGNFVIVFALKINLASGGTPGVLNCVLYLNSVICLIAGIYFFNERHRYQKYLGGIIIMASVVLLTLERTFELPGLHSFGENIKYVYSLLLSALACVLWSIAAVAGKYAFYNYKCSPMNFSILTILVCGVTGSFVFILIVSENTGLELKPGQSFLYTMVRIVLAGVFSVIGYLAHFKASSLGPVEVCQLFVNLKSVVQIVEEFLFMNLIPSMISSIGKVTA